MNLRRLPFCSFLLASLCLAALPAQAVTNPPPPQPVPMPPAIVAPVDQPYAGPLQLEVDVTNIRDRVAQLPFSAAKDSYEG